MTSLKILGVSGGVGQPSRTTHLVREVLRELESLTQVKAQLIEVAEVGPLVGACVSRQQLSAAGEAVLAQIENADVIVAGSPVYKGAYSGQFKHLFDMLDPNALLDVPVVLAATGGSDRHALMPDHCLRPLFSFFRAHTVPTTLYATAAQIDHGQILDRSLYDRIQLAARQAIHLLDTPARRRRTAAAHTNHAAP
jgi:FMN reductase